MHLEIAAYKRASAKILKHKITILWIMHMASDQKYCSWPVLYCSVSVRNVLGITSEQSDFTSLHLEKRELERNCVFCVPDKVDAGLLH